MAYLCTVEFSVGIEALEKAEREHPHVIEAIGKAAEGLMKSHRRYVRAGQVLDIDEYDSEEDYKKFIDLARNHIEEYGRLAGTEAVDTLYKFHSAI